VPLLVQFYFIEMLKKFGGIGPVRQELTCRHIASSTSVNLPIYRKKSEFFGAFSVFLVLFMVFSLKT
jgi:hypothetical protein